MHPEEFFVGGLKLRFLFTVFSPLIFGGAAGDEGSIKSAAKERHRFHSPPHMITNTCRLADIFPSLDLPTAYALIPIFSWFDKLIDPRPDCARFDFWHSHEIHKN